MSNRLLHVVRSSAARAIALVFVFSLAWTGKMFAATNWSDIQSALGANGTVLPGNVLRFELVRLDLPVSVNGTSLPAVEVAAVANGFVAFKAVRGGEFFADGSLPAQESELAGLLAALRANHRVHITAIGNRIPDVSPELLSVHFEATGDGSSLASTLATALGTIQDPQMNVVVIPGTNSVFDPASILPPQFLKLFNEGFVEQLDDTFAFYLPRPDENEISLGDVRAETGLGVGQSFNVQVDFSGGTSVTLDIDFALRAGEVQAVEDELRAGGFAILSQSNHYIGEEPRLYFVHAQASGDGFSLGNTLYEVIQTIQADSRHRRDHDGGWR
jgi:Domain of Unknown Function (DUF1259)